MTDATTITRDGITVTAKRVLADLDGALYVTGYLLTDERGAMLLGFERDAADAIMASNNLHEEGWESEHTEYDADRDAYVLSSEGDVVEVDEGEDWGDLHLYFIGSRLSYVWGWTRPEDPHRCSYFEQSWEPEADQLSGAVEYLRALRREGFAEGRTAQLIAEGFGISADEVEAMARV